MRALIVKTSSLGDLIHTLPAISDAARATPGLSVEWLVERSFAEVPGWHSAVTRVISCDLRAWRQHPLRSGRPGLRELGTALRNQPYDLIVDAQGLVKSAWLARRARGPLAGPDFRGAREPLAALLYTRRIAVPRHDAQHAVARLRQLFAAAFGYSLPDNAPDFGLEPTQFALPELARHWTQPYVVLLHGTTWKTKRWPLAHWSALGQSLSARGLRVALPWGNDDEKASAYTIANSCGGVVLPRLGLTALAGWLAHARAVVGVDTGLAHLAAALGTPQVSLYGPTLPALTGTIGRNQTWLRSSEDDHIDRLRPTTIAVEQVETALAQWL